MFIDSCGTSIQLSFEPFVDAFAMCGQLGLMVYIAGAGRKREEEAGERERDQRWETRPWADR